MIVYDWLLIWHIHKPDGSVENKVSQVRGSAHWVNHIVSCEPGILQTAYDIKPDAGKGRLKVLLHSATRLESVKLEGTQLEAYLKLSGEDRSTD